MTRNNISGTAKAIVAGALVAALTGGVTCAYALAVDDVFEPAVCTWTVGLDKTEAVIAARNFVGIPAPCVSRTDTTLVEHDKRPCWRVEIEGSMDTDIDWVVLVDACDGTVVDWWYE